MTKKDIINIINEIDENLSPMFNDTENLDTSDYLEVRYIDLSRIHDLVYKLKEIVGDNSENRYSQKEIIKEINRLKDIEIAFNDTKISNYEKAYNVLMDYFDYIPEEEKENLDKQLKKLGL